MEGSDLGLILAAGCRHDGLDWGGRGRICSVLALLPWCSCSVPGYTAPDNDNITNIGIECE